MTPLTINVPIVFHLIDATLKKNNIQYFTTHINNNIIATLNTDYNRSFENYDTNYVSQIDKLFVNADKSKREYYTNLRNVLPKDINIVWKFYLKDVIIKTVGALSIDANNLEPIYKAVSVVDPESQ